MGSSLRVSVRAEVADSLDTDACINAIIRCLARRGEVKLMLSDNGTNFVSANRELSAELAKLNSTKIQGQLALKGIEWRFNPPYGSHFGGVWERLIRSVRKILHGLMKEQ